jgi:predicted dinucleotide-binding enzyme
MKIGIIGAGNIGATAAKLFAEAGYDVAISNSRGPESLDKLSQEIGVNVNPMEMEDAAKFGEVVLIAIPFGKYQTLPAEKLVNKIVIDAGNYYPERDGTFAEIESGKITSSELVAGHLKGSTIVKAFNTIWSEHLKTQGDKDQPFGNRRVIFVCGDDSDAKHIVSKMIREIGFGAYDTGNLSEGGKTQAPGSAIYNRNMKVTEVDAVLHSGY